MSLVAEHGSLSDNYLPTTTVSNGNKRQIKTFKEEIFLVKLEMIRLLA